MKLKILLSIVSVIALFNSSISQTVFWTEDFGTGCDQGNSANGTTTTNGTWSVTTTGTNGAGANEWFISATEAGVGVGNCGDGCLQNASATSRTLHVGNVATGYAACLFCAAGDCGAAYSDFSAPTGFCATELDPTMNARAESPTIDCSGQTGITLDFAYITAAQPGVDFCTVEYFDGATWSTLGVPTQTTVGTCSPQHQWAAYNVALPASADNNPNVKIGFRWEQVADDGGSDPSFAVDDITLSTAAASAPTADFSASNVTICEGDCIDFTDLSSVSTNPSWSWTFSGAATGTSTSQNPTGICYNTAGTYDVELTVTDDDGTDTETKVGFITVNAQGNAGSDVSSNECEGITVDLNTLLSGADAGGTWVETSGTSSGQFNTGTGELNTSGLPIGNTYTFDYTVGTAPCDSTATVTITIIDCSVLLADFTPSRFTICEGECITVTDNSNGAITSWDWTFNGSDTPTATGQNPGTICWNSAGTYDMTLVVGDGTNTDDTTIQITVDPAPVVTATASPNDTVCAGDQVTLTGGGATNYSWDNGVTNGVAFTPTATATYTVTGTDANGCDGDTTITITVENCDSLIASFYFPSSNICLGDCITFTDSSSGNIVDWNWDFGGGATPNTSTDQNPTACFTSTGTFNIQLTITDAGGNNASTTQSISVFPTPSVTAELDTLIDLGGEAELISSGSTPGVYQWNPSQYVDCDSCAVTFASPIQNTEYIVTLTDVNGCSAQDTVQVDVNFIEGIGVPTAFSPNGDGNNDLLFVKGLGITSMNFTVYNRYGQKVFETDNQDIGWDGKFKGKDENSGVFTWVLEYTLINGSSGVLKGNTTLLR